MILIIILTNNHANLRDIITQQLMSTPHFTKIVGYISPPIFTPHLWISPVVSI